MGAYEWRPGPDLAGVWKKLSLSKNLKTITASFEVKNLKSVKAGPFKVFFLSFPRWQEASFRSVQKGDLVGRAQQRGH